MNDFNSKFDLLYHNSIISNKKLEEQKYLKN